MKLNIKIVVVVLQLALIPWFIGGFFVYSAARDQLSRDTFTHLDTTAEIQESRLEDTLQNKLNLVSLFATNSLLEKALHEMNVRPSSSTEKAVQTVLTDIEGNATNIRKAFVANTAGLVVASSDRSLLGTNISTERYFKLGIQHPDGSQLAVERTNGVLHYAVSPIRFNGETIAMVAVVTVADDIISVTQDFTGLGGTGETLLISDDGHGNPEFIAPTRFNPNGASGIAVSKERKDIPSVHALAGEKGIFNNVLDYRGVPVIAATRYMKETGWGIVVKLNQAEAFGPIAGMQELFLLVTVIVWLFVILVGISISKSILDPIRDLTVLVNKISKGNLSERVAVTSRDEIGTLGIAFNNMLSKLTESYAMLERKVEERTKDLVKKAEEAKDAERAAFNIASDLKYEEEKLVEEKMRAENLASDLVKFKLALDNASDQVIITDPSGTVVYGNKAVERITGYTTEEALGKKAGALWKYPMPTEYYKNFWHTIADLKQPFIGEIQNKRKNGEIYTAMISVSPVFDKDRNTLFYVGLERDITKEKEIDKAKSEFISLASHQMRTPLTVINWYSEMLLGGDAGELNEKQKEYFTEVHAAGQRMNGIIKSFLHILRLETGMVVVNPVPISLQDIARSIVKEAKADPQKRRLTIIERYQEPLPLVKADTELVRVILQNLISNAIKYSPEELEVAVSLDSVKKGNVVAGKTASEDSVLVSVHDAGIGIPTNDRDKIFTKFFRSDNARKQDPNGNGIGLYMTKFMVDIVGGIVWFESEEGKGTTFYLLLPLEGKKLV